MSTRVLDLFAGPGGWDQGARDAGLDLDITGVELDPHACATARAAGHTRLQADAHTLDLAEWAHARGLIASPPCPTWSAAGRRSALADLDRVLDTMTGIGWWEPGPDGEPAAWAPVAWADIAAEVGQCADPRTGLFAIAAWAALRLPALDWVVMEQVPAAEPLFEDIAVELASIGWSADTHVVDATALGMPVRRRRVYLVAWRPGWPGAHPDLQTPIPGPSTMAAALGWPAGHRVITRGNRAAGGGNAFSADGPSWALTGSARSWARDDGHRLTIAEASRLHGFPADYPWSGSRTRRFLQVADVVLPPIAARILTAVARPQPGTYLPPTPDYGRGAGAQLALPVA